MKSATAILSDGASAWWKPFDMPQVNMWTSISSERTVAMLENRAKSPEILKSAVAIGNADTLGREGR